ncbi:MAG: 1-deoxy-D-xylulose-5-phosphate synthase [Oscillospiraceae bacterium]
MKTDYLDKINSPDDVKKLDFNELVKLSEEIRTFLIENISKTGGHLSSNLGTIELTIALHKVFSTPKDQIVWDVGHQSYTHKILTGRKDGFDSMRMKDGISGFPAPKESEHDVFISGHGNTSISAAIGLASAKKIKHEDGMVIAVIGDGAFTGGMVYEGINNIGVLNNLIVILNDNEMSISKNVGSVAHYFTQLRTSPAYFKAKRDVETMLDATPVIGSAIKSGIQKAKSAFRRSIYHSTFFEEMGFQYVGPVDGHNLPELCVLLSHFTELTGPLFIHAVTVKGKGFKPAEQNPGAFHGVSAFDADHVTDPDVAPEGSFSTVFGQKLVECADENGRICAITAAMKYGTGLQFFYKQYKERFFDVGMAEQHAVTFAAGLAKNGMLPVVSIYSTFLQRSYDQIIHDVNLQQLNVLFCIDRAGLVPGDGETHQGIYDAAFLSELDGFQIVSPCNYAELEYWLCELLSDKYTKPRAIRYPRGNETPILAQLGCTENEFDCVYKAEDAKLAVVTYGSESSQAVLAVRAAEANGKNADLYKLTVIHPLPNGIVDALLGYENIIFAEEGIATGGIAEQLCTALYMAGFKGKYRQINVPNLGVTHAKIPQLREMFGLDSKSLISLISEVCS